MATAEVVSLEGDMSSVDKVNKALSGLVEEGKTPFQLDRKHPLARRVISRALTYGGATPESLAVQIAADNGIVPSQCYL